MNQGTLFENPLKWECVYRNPVIQKAATWRHWSGWIVQHCGHPTALYPWYIETPSGQPSGAGTFRHLADAKTEAERLFNLSQQKKKTKGTQCHERTERTARPTSRRSFRVRR